MCWNRQPEKGNVNPRKEISYYGITICRAYIVLINIGDDTLSLLRLPPLNKFCQPTNRSQGVVTKGTLSWWTASQVVLEGGVASKLEVVEEILNGDDDFSIKIKSNHVTYLYARSCSEQ